ncbi:double-strand break repair protein AddB [Rhodospirillaceae bacterium SYSU D60014]|uniref:double-strand break repair protein AddB n=1 Tax=Virgifigura deserti TaxID=2268457 RepID=UPI000E65FA82
MTDGPRPRRSVFTIPSGVSFVDALAARLLAEADGDPLALARGTILLPNRRGCRALQEAFLRQSRGRPLLLPRMMPIGDLDTDELTLASGIEVGGPAAEALDMAPAIPPLRRHLLLTRAILAAFAGWKAADGPADGDAWRGGTPPTVDQAARLATELARLLDQIQTEQLPFDGLRALAPEDYAIHWQVTLKFLEILTEVWPRILEEQGCVDPAVRRNLLLAAQAEAWRRSPPADPVTVAGSTGSIPATAELIEVVAGLPRGRVVLPGLDRDAGEACWREIVQDPSHPQHGLHLLLDRLGLEPRDVAVWPDTGERGTPPMRARLIAEALRPAATTDGWRHWAATSNITAIEFALRDVSRIDCPGPQEEAGAIALMLRETLEVPGKRAALVTPDRALARRVAAELRRWDITIDDSAGRPLADTPPGTFLRLTAELLVERVAPVSLLALLKHPLAAGGMEPPAFRALARRLEIGVLRGPRPAAGFDGLVAALPDNLRDPLGPWVRQLATAAAPFAALIAARETSLDALLTAHVAFAEALAASASLSGAERLWAGEAGEAAADFVADLRQAAHSFSRLPGARYPALLSSLMSDLVVRPRYGRHPRIAIWGPLEARLQHVDLLILGGLNEGTWPPEPWTDPWLSRPMRRAFGLPAPERRIGLAAHDFIQAFSAPEVVLTRALRVEGTPTVPSRWLMRFDGLLRTAGITPDRMRPSQWLDWQAKLDRPAHVLPIAPPMPRPPVGARPRRLSVTEVETWMRDPYAIYARHILRLRPLDPIDADPGAADRGAFIHRALDRFVKDHPGPLPADALDRLLAIGAGAFGDALSRPSVWAFWWPRFERIARWFLAQEQERRDDLLSSLTEVRGRLTLAAPGGAFELVAKADRVDCHRDGAAIIIDYKTGALPVRRDIDLGFSPQLPLEAAIALAGGFDGLPAGPVGELAYWQLVGGDPAGKIDSRAADCGDVAAAALAGLARLVAAFDDEATPYLAEPNPACAPRYSDYGHLARIKEWSAGGPMSSE